MHSSHQSRGRIFFDFLCTLIVVASCVGAWKQTGAEALLGVAAAAGLYGLVHLFDMRSTKSADAAEPQRIDFSMDPQNDVAPKFASELPPVELEQLSAAQVEQAVEAEPVETQTKPARKAKASRKASSRRPSATKGAKVIELAAPVESEVPELEAAEEEDFPPFAAPSEMSHPHIEPLFEPERFGRVPRRAFGRRGQI